MADTTSRVIPKVHRTDGIVQKLDNKADELQAKAEKHGKKSKKDDGQPAGGLDETPVPRAPAGFTLKIIFHNAHNLPMADILAHSSDPYIKAVLTTSLRPRHRQDPPMQWRTPTIHKSTEPVWDSEWIVANVPASGFQLKARIYDEDPADHDDRLGNVHVDCDGISEDWQGIDRQAFSIKKRMGSKRAYLIRGCAAMFDRNIKMSGTLMISVQCLGRTKSDDGGRMWTAGPCAWSKHTSPMIGRIAGTKGDEKAGETKSYDFQANQMQLAGPIPADLYHRYVEFKSFIKGMFTGTSLRGKLLRRALRHEHARIYNYDSSTKYGTFASPSTDMTLKFLDLVHYDQGGRIWTYVLTLDGQWRFTETGKEFGIDFLSKHTMHSDVNIYIAYSGEFFIRRLSSSKKGGAPDQQQTHPPTQVDGGPPKDDPPQDPAQYSLIIDNDSGTYRPSAKLLPQLKAFMEQNLPGLKVVTLDCNGDKEKMNKWKDEQRERKKAEGSNMVIIQGDDSSISSSEADDLDAQEREMSGQPKLSKKDKMHQKLYPAQSDPERQGPSGEHARDTGITTEKGTEAKVISEKQEHHGSVEQKLTEPFTKVEEDHEGKMERERRETE